MQKMMSEGQERKRKFFSFWIQKKESLYSYSSFKLILPV